MRLTFLGTADAFNGAGRAHSCYWVDDTHGAYTVDFGPTALMQCKRLGREPDQLDGVFLTHLHGDHIGGLAVLLIHLQFVAGRTRPFVIAGPAGTEDRVTQLRESAYPSLLRGGLPFPLLYRHWKVPGEVEVLGRRVRAIRARHDRFSMATSLRVHGSDYALAFSGDTGWQDGLAELSTGVDAFVCECSGVKAGYWAHLSVEELEAHRAALSPRRFFVSHLSEESRVAAAASETLAAEIADDGLVVDFG